MVKMGCCTVNHDRIEKNRSRAENAMTIVMLNWCELDFTDWNGDRISSSINPIR